MANSDHTEHNIARLLEALADEPVQANPAFRSRLRASLHDQAAYQALPWWQRLARGDARLVRRLSLATAFAAVLALALALGLLLGALFYTPTPDAPTLLTVRSGSVVVQQTRSSLLGIRRETTRTLQTGESLSLAQGDRVIASSEASAILTYSDNSWSELQGGADVTLALVRSPTPGTPPRVSLQVRAGSTRHHVELYQTVEQPFQVETANSVVSMQGGDFAVTVISAAHTYLTTDEGLVNLALADGQTIEVQPGYQADIQADQPLKLRPRPPTLKAVSAGQGAELKLAGQTAPGATLLLYTQGLETARIEANDQGQFNHVFTAPATGVYRLQLATIGIDSHKGDLSAPLVWIYRPALSLWLWQDPQEGAGRARLGGRAKPGDNVSINAEPAPVNPDGDFETGLELAVGRQTLSVLVNDKPWELTITLGQPDDLRATLIPLENKPAPGFSIVQSAPAVVNPGQTFTYTLVAQNHTGLMPALTVITSSIPSGAAFISASHNGLQSAGVLTWNVPNLADGDTVTRTFRVTATTRAAAITNRHYGVSGGRDWITTTLGRPVVVQVPQLLIAKSGPQAVEPGAVFSYTLNITNHTFSALDLTISDTLPPGLRYKSSHPAGDWDPASRTLTWNVPGLSCSRPAPGSAGGCQGATSASLTRTIVITAPDTITAVVNSDYAAWDDAQAEFARGAPLLTSVGRPISISQVQGRGARSPLVGQTVQTAGVIVGLGSRRGLYLQSLLGDGDDATSDGILVTLPDGSNPNLRVGRLLTVTGTVGEYSPAAGLQCQGNACQTQIQALAVQTGQDLRLPAPVELNPPGALASATAYWEAREGMLVTLPHTATVVGANMYRDLMVVRGDLGLERVLAASPYAGMPVGARGDQTQNKLTVGSVIENVHGPLAHTQDGYVIITQPGDAWRSVSTRPAPTPAPSWPQPSADAFSAATFNVPGLDATSVNKVVATVVQMGCPSLLALQQVAVAQEDLEVEGVMPNLLSSLRLKGCPYNYAQSLTDGRAVVLLWRSDLVKDVAWSAQNHCSTSGNPSAAHDAQWAQCQSAGADLYPLFSQPPIVFNGVLNLASGDLPLTVIACQFDAGKDTTARRLEQAQFVAGLANSAAPHTIVLGDLNDTENSPTLQALYDAGGLVNTWFTLPQQTRYSYNQRGLSLARDHVLASPALMALLQQAGALHYNSDYLYGYSQASNTVWRASTHDPLAATFAQTTLHLTKTVQSLHTPARLGEPITYTLVLANREDQDAAPVTISDVLPPGLEGANLNWTGVVSAHGQVQFNIPAVLTSSAAFYGQTINNTAYYSYTGVRGQASASFSVAKAPPPRLTLAKTVESVAPVRPGDLVTYTILLSNDGQAASGIVLADAWPPGASFAGWADTPPHNTNVANDSILWSGGLGAGQTLTWTFRARASGIHSATIVNTASVGYNGARIEDTAAFDLEPQPAASVIINEIMPNPASVPDLDGEWIELYNASDAPVDLNGCTLRDDGANAHRIDNGQPLLIKPGQYLLLGANGDRETNGGVSLAYVYTGWTLEDGGDQIILECDGLVDRVNYPASLSAEGASAQLKAPALDNAASANWCVAATAWPGSAGDAGTPGAANNCPLPDLSISNTVETAQPWSETVRPGQALTYTIVVANHGNTEALAVRVNDNLPPGIIGAGLDQTVDIAAGGRRVFVVPATVTTDSAYHDRSIVNTAYYYHRSGSGSGSAGVVIKPLQPQLSVTKTVETLSTPVRLGDPVAYTMVVSNSGAALAQGVVLTDALPPGLDLGGCLRNECTAQLSSPGNTVVWSTDVPAGESYTMRFITTLTNSVAFRAQVITNTVVYTSLNAGGGRQSVAFAVEPVPALPPLALTVTLEVAHEQILLGDPITYTVVAANLGNEDVANVVISDDLPAGIEGTNLRWTGALTAHSQITFTIPAVITTNVAYYGQTIFNVAHYSYPGGSGSSQAPLTIHAAHRIFMPISVPDR
jgi:uncharacterized repeat protein (TIGR01451 family)